MDVKALHLASPNKPSNWERPGTWESLVKLGHATLIATQGQASNQRDVLGSRGQLPFWAEDHRERWSPPGQ